MRNIFTFFLLACSISSIAQNAFVVENNASVTKNLNQNIRINSDVNSTIIDKITLGYYAVVNQVISGGVFEGGNRWGQVDMAGTISAQSGYVALGVPCMLPNCSKSYVYVTSGPINIRSAAGIGNSQVTINNQPAKVFNGQRFALVSTSGIVNGDYVWNQIYLTMNCSQPMGWIAVKQISSGTIMCTINQSALQVLDAPTLNNATNITSNSADIAATNNINYYWRNYDLNVNGSIQNGYFTSGTSPYVPVTDNKTITGLAPGNTYNVYAIEKNNSGCFSGNSNTINFSIAGGGCTPPATPTGFNATAVSNSQINLSWNAVPSATGYEIYDCNTGNLFYSTISTSVQINGLQSNTFYQFKVVSLNTPLCKSQATNCQGATTLADNGGCTTPSVTANATPTSVNIGGTFQLTAFPSQTGTYSYSWSGPNGFTSTSQNPTISNLGLTSLGNYCVTMTKPGCNPSTPSCVNVNLTSAGCNLSVNITGNTSISCGQKITLTANPSETGVTYSWAGPSGFAANTSTININNGGNSHTGIYTVTVSKAGCSSASTSKDVAVMGCANPTITIDESKSDIQPWEREDETIVKTVFVNIAPSTYKNWMLRIYYNTIPIKTYNNLIYSNNIAINSNDWGIPLKNGDVITYKAFLLDNSLNPIASSSGQSIETDIIDKKWEKKNYVYFKDENSPDKIKIPLRYRYNGYSPTKVVIKRVGYTSVKLIVPVLPSSLESKFNPNDKFFLLTPNEYKKGYLTINSTNSNLWDVLPGDFQYIVYSGEDILLEDGYFDLTKIGKISSNYSPKLLVQIGGIFNEIEGDAHKLKTGFPDAQESKSDLSFSSIEYCRNKLNSGSKEGPYSTWYIAQGNANYIERNGYDLGIALQKIRDLNNQAAGYTSEINLFCHSKGGLDIRALLASINYSYDGKNKIIFQNSVLNNILKKVVCIATPHRGAIMANIGNGLSLNFWDIPALNDLMIGNSTIEKLRKANMPGNIWFANITGYYNNIKLTDGVVEITSSYNPPFNSSKVIQMFQNETFNDPTTLPFHIKIHESDELRYVKGYITNNINCTSDKGNLAKLVDFIANTPDPSQSCKITLSSILLSIIKSKLSGATVYIKLDTDSSYRYLGTTDENGQLSYNQLDGESVFDSIKIKSNGTDSLIVQAKDLLESNHKAPIAMLNFGTTNKVKYPVFDFTTPQLITSQTTLKIKTTGINVKSYEISNNGSPFTSLTLSSNMATINLDTGYNKLTVRFSGVDTLFQTKEIYYLPDTLYNQYSRNVFVTTNAEFIGARVFVDNQFVNKIRSTSDSIRILKVISQVKFSREGYKDAVYYIESDSSINLKMTPISYSSETDSTLVNFSTGLNPQYWKTVTTKNLSNSSNTQVSIKQYDDSFTGMGLKPQSRKFVFRNLNPNQPVLLKTAIALDQIKTPDSSKVYLLNIKNGNRYYKYLANKANVSEYDPEVQKIAFDSLNFNTNAATEELVLLAKLPPILLSPEIIMHQGETRSFPINDFVKDPDSLKNDIFSKVLSSNVYNDANTITITAATTDVSATIRLSFTHDFVTLTKDYPIKLIPPKMYIPNAFTPNGDGLNDVLKPLYFGKLNYCKFSVYNRFGQQIFESSDCVTGWNGKINGVLQNSGIYAWILTYQFEGEKPKTEKGTVTIMK